MHEEKDRGKLRSAKESNSYPLPKLLPKEFRQFMVPSSQLAVAKEFWLLIALWTTIKNLHDFKVKVTCTGIAAELA